MLLPLPPVLTGENTQRERELFKEFKEFLIYDVITS
jgi:hypothetical protein